MKWFKHDTGAMLDAKLMKVRHKYGMQGYGLYWYCIELIAGCVSVKNITFELEHDAETIATEWGMDQIKVQEMMGFMVNLGLFEQQENGRITCMKLAKRLDDTNAKNPQIKQILSDLLRETPRNSDLLRETPARLDEIRLDKNKKESRTTTTRPSVSEVADYVETRTVKINPQAFIDYYQANGWKVGRNSMKDWKAAVRTWEKNEKQNERQGNSSRKTTLREDLTDVSWAH